MGEKRALTIVHVEGKREREDNILKDPAPSVEGLPVSVGSV